MNREQLSHLLRAASRIADEEQIVVIGSQSILGTFDETQLPPEAVFSMEADFAFWNDENNAKSDAVDGVMGEDSQFHATHGYYAQGVSISTAVLPDGWESRIVILEGESTKPGRGMCLEPHDAVIAKLVAYREKDLEFSSALVNAGLVDPHLLLQRLAMTALAPTQRERVARWISSYA